MAATAGTGTARRPLTPEEVIDAHANAMKDAVRRLLSSNDALRAEVLKVQAQLQDALDRVSELATEGRGKDQMIAELQQLTRVT